MAAWRSGSSKQGALYRFAMYPIGAGEPKMLPATPIRIEQADWLPDGRRIVFSGSEPDRGSRIWVQGFDDAKPTARLAGGLPDVREGRLSPMAGLWRRSARTSASISIRSRVESRRRSRGS